MITPRNRRYCSWSCRADASNARRRARRAELRELRERHAGALRAYAEEQTGQLPLPGLPPLVLPPELVP